MCNTSVGVVKSTKQFIVPPNETKTVTGFVRKQKDIESRLKEQIESEMIKEKLLNEERDRQRLKDEKRMLLLKTLEELKLKNREIEKDIQEKEKRRINVDVELEIEKENQEYDRLLQRKRIEESRYMQQVAEDRMKREREKEIEERLLKERIRREVEKEIRKEMEMKSKETKEKERIRKEKLDKRKVEELDLIRSIEQLKIMEREVKDIKGEMKDIDEVDVEEKNLEIKLNHLKKEKEMLEEKIRKESDVTKRKETIEHTTKDSQKFEKAIGKPKLLDFDGTQFEEWKLEVISLQESKLYTDLILSRTVRNSLTGKARKVLPTLKPSASTEEILKKLGDIYGNIRSGDSIIHDFYSAKQTKTESCSRREVLVVQEYRNRQTRDLSEIAIFKTLWF